MNRLTRWYNQNRQMLWTIILSIVGVIALIQILNNYYKTNAKEESSSTNISTTTYNTPNYSVVTQEKIDKTISEKSDTLIDNFFKFCNDGKIEEAYNILSIDCKEELYPTINEFTEKYYNRIFTEKRSYKSTLWISSNTSNTYRVEIMSDILATGQREINPIEDYYTVVLENGKYKLNISRYIGKEELNLSKAEDNITVNLISKKLYMEYEKYEISIKNNTGAKLIFNTKQNINSIYIQDENGLEYTALLHEIADNELNISNGFTRNLVIKFNRGYKPNIDIEKIVFGDIDINGKEVLIDIQI